MAERKKKPRGKDTPRTTKNQSARGRVREATSAGERRPGTEVWLVAQENAWESETRGLPPRRGSS